MLWAALVMRKYNIINVTSLVQNPLVKIINYLKIKATNIVLFYLYGIPKTSLKINLKKVEQS